MAWLVHNKSGIFHIGFRFDGAEIPILLVHEIFGLTSRCGTLPSFASCQSVRSETFVNSDAPLSVMTSSKPPGAIDSAPWVVPVVGPLMLFPPFWGFPSSLAKLPTDNENISGMSRQIQISMQSVVFVDR